MMDSVSKSLLKQGLDSLNQALLARVSSAESGEVVDYEAPSEAQFAASVAKDMASDALASRKVWWIGAAVVLLIIILVIVILSQG